MTYSRADVKHRGFSDIFLSIVFIYPSVVSRSASVSEL